MDDEAILAAVKEVVEEILKADPEEIKAEARFDTELDADSTQSLELMAGFEAKFDIEMDLDDAMAVKTVGGAVEFIKKVIEEQHGQS